MKYLLTIGFLMLFFPGNISAQEEINIEKSEYQGLHPAPNGVMYNGPEIKVSNVYPNPSREKAKINYRKKEKNLSFKMIIHNLLGDKIMEFLLPDQQKTIHIPGENLKPGIYFYTLCIRDKGIATKKMIIKD